MINISHMQAQGLIQKGADHPLSLREQASLNTHLAECNSCSSYSNRLNQMQADLRDISRSRWSRNVPDISTELIKKRSRSVAVKKNMLQMLASAAVVIILITALLLIGSFLRNPLEFPSIPIKQSTQTLSATEIASGNESSGSPYLEQSQITSPFPPSGIGKLCKSTSATPQIGDGNLIWPTRNHYLAGKDFSNTHPAIDIAGDLGDAVWAADSGVAIMAGFNTWGYGNLVILDHGKGRYTLYGHLDTLSVTCGQNVQKGQLIGSIGKSGNTPRTELHFQVLSGSTFVNPWSVLPPADKCYKINYIVQEGDTLLRIALLYDISPESIRAENHLTDVLYTGIDLTIPLCPK